MRWQVNFHAPEWRGRFLLSARHHSVQGAGKKSVPRANFTLEPGDLAVTYFFVAFFLAGLATTWTVADPSGASIWVGAGASICASGATMATL